MSWFGQMPQALSFQPKRSHLVTSGHEMIRVAAGGNTAKKRARVAPTLSIQETAALAALADQLGVSKSWLVRRAVQNLLHQYKDDPEQLRLDLDLPKS